MKNYSKKPKVLIYWNVRRVDHHFSDAVNAMNSSWDVTFLGNNKYSNRIEFKDANPRDYDFLLSYDSGSQTFNESGNRYDKRVDDIHGIPRILRVIDVHLRPEEHRSISSRYDKVFYTSPGQKKYIDTEAIFLPPHINTRYFNKYDPKYSANVFNCTEKIVSQGLASSGSFNSSLLSARISFLIKFLDPRHSRASSIFNKLTEPHDRWIIAKAFRKDAVYIHHNSDFSLHLKCDKFFNYATWRPLDAFAGGSIPIVEMGEDDTWNQVFEYFGVMDSVIVTNNINDINTNMDSYMSIRDAFKRKDLIEKSKVFDINNEIETILERI